MAEGIVMDPLCPFFMKCIMSVFHVSAYDIQALADHELGREDVKQVELYLYNTPEAQYYYEELLHQKTLLKAWWKEISHENLNPPKGQTP